MLPHNNLPYRYGFLGCVIYQYPGHNVNNIIFMVIIFLANIVQGITGFAGTVLAMPPSLFFVDLNVAKPVLNILGIFSGIYICAIAYCKINRKVLVKVFIIMLVGLVSGFYIVDRLRDYEEIQYKVLGIFILFIGIYYITAAIRKKNISFSEPALNVILFLSGVFHGMFVCGGPLLVIYMAKKVPEKSEFRATISCVWLVLNSIIFAQHFHEGYFVYSTSVLSAIAVPVLFAGMFVGNIIHRKISQELFLTISYILLIVSGISLLLK